MLSESGIGVADITKLKANGFYTVAVCQVSRLTPLVSLDADGIQVRPRGHPQDPTEDQGV